MNNQKIQGTASTPDTAPVHPIVIGYIDGEFRKGELTHQFANGRCRVKYDGDKESRAMYAWESSYEAARRQAFWSAVRPFANDLMHDVQSAVMAVHEAAIRWEISR